jgi:hypothetical protein
MLIKNAQHLNNFFFPETIHLDYKIGALYWYNNNNLQWLLFTTHDGGWYSALIAFIAARTFWSASWVSEGGVSAAIGVGATPIAITVGGLGAEPGNDLTAGTDDLQ